MAGSSGQGVAVEAQSPAFLHNDPVPISLYGLGYNTCKASPLGSGLKVATEATELHIGLSCCYQQQYPTSLRVALVVYHHFCPHYDLLHHKNIFNN